MVPFYRLRKRKRKIKCLARGHTAGCGMGTPVCLTPKPKLEADACYISTYPRCLSLPPAPVLFPWKHLGAHVSSLHGNVVSRPWRGEGDPSSGSAGSAAAAAALRVAKNAQGCPCSAGWGTWIHVYLPTSIKEPQQLPGMMAPGPGWW